MTFGPKAVVAEEFASAARSPRTPTDDEGRYAVERAARAQFGPGFRHFGDLRRRRNELEYPERPCADATNEEATEAVENAGAIITAAQRLLDQLGLF